MRELAVVMGVPTSLHLPARRGLAAEDPGAARAAVADALDLLRAAERRFSRHVPGSELDALRRGVLTEDDVSTDMRAVLAVARAAERDSGGAFRTVGPDGLLDTDGVVKGWAVQRAADLLGRRGVTDLCLNAGGDVVVRGEPEPGTPWTVAVRDPADPHRQVAVVRVVDGAVATSGAYERGPHVWDGRTGAAAHGLASATVVAGDLTAADVLATAAFARGAGGGAWATRHGAAWALEVRPDGRVVTDVAAAAGPAAPLPGRRRARRS
ncbi:FAD:protein FMN transferase [Isoptericola sp. BMS4]|uniref:FAD:protein FMN transferase n=1 Tax=Isoptericola sp. BMS4 TaxID=2527875 RepID=UPI0014240F23|nr:FAD:protein FMN transferase [Isoptericola sp. BMS4]